MICKRMLLGMPIVKIMITDVVKLTNPTSKNSLQPASLIKKVCVMYGIKKHRIAIAAPKRITVFM